MALGISYAGYRNGFPGKVHHAMEDGTPFELFAFGTAHPTTGRAPDHTMGPGTYYPIGLTLSEITELYWRVKKYHFDSTIQFTEVLSPYETWDASTSGTEFVNGSSEVSLIGIPASPGVPSTEFLGGTLDATLFGTASDGIGGTIINALIFSDQTPSGTPIHPVRYFDGKWWPSLAVETGYEGAALHYVFTDAVWVESDSAWTAEQVATMDFFGHTVKLYAYPDVTATGTVTVTAEEWWGYGGKFNTATGA